MEGADDALVISHLNIRSLLSKKDEIQLFLQQHTCAFVFGLSETWLHDSVPTGELAVSGFRTHRRDRGGRGGGLLVYVSECMISIRRHDLEVADLETLWIEMRLRKTKILISNLYRPPGAKVAWMAVSVEKAVAEKVPVMIRVTLTVICCYKILSHRDLKK